MEKEGPGWGCSPSTSPIWGLCVTWGKNLADQKKKTQNTKNPHSLEKRAQIFFFFSVKGVRVPLS
jgi:hypothetical protein